MATEVEQVVTKDLISAQRGIRFVANNPTPGTGLATHAAPTTYDETKPVFYVFNPSSNPRTIYPQCLRFFVTVISTGGTGSKYTFSSDVGDLYSSGGTALTVSPVNRKTTNTQIKIFAGAVTAATAVSSQLLANCTPRGAVVETVWDEYQFVFGATDGSVTNAANTGAAAQTSSSFKLPPIGIAPGTCLKVVQWKASQTVGPVLEVFFDYLEL